MTTGYVPRTAHVERHDHHQLVGWLWIVQFGLAGLYLFTGTMKWMMPMDQLTQMSHLPGPFMRGIATAELLGALGLILPGLVGVARWLTPLAATGLVIIMIGATSETIEHMSVGAAIVPFVAGLLALFVAVARWRLETE
jgi:hypothetical protein